MKREWYVYYYDINGRVLEKFNIFEHGSFNAACNKLHKKYKDDKDTFKDKLRSELFYYFCSKVEWEVLISPFPPDDKVKSLKIDVYNQVMLNYDIFAEYVWGTYK